MIDVGGMAFVVMLVFFVLSLVLLMERGYGLVKVVFGLFGFLFAVLGLALGGSVLPFFPYFNVLFAVFMGFVMWSGSVDLRKV